MRNELYGLFLAQFERKKGSNFTEKMSPNSDKLPGSGREENLRTLCDETLPESTQGAGDQNTARDVWKSAIKSQI